MTGGRHHNFVTETLNDLAIGGQVTVNPDCEKAGVAVIVAVILFHDFCLRVSSDVARLLQRGDIFTLRVDDDVAPLSQHIKFAREVMRHDCCDIFSS